MGETARERFHRMQQEKAKATPATVSESAAGSPVADIKARLLEKRRDELSRRLHALGVPTPRAELPTNEADIADLERFCDEQEKAAT